MKNGIIPLYHHIRKKTKKFFNIHELAKKYTNACLQYDILGNKMIGLDTSLKRLVYLQFAAGTPTITEIEFSGINSCILKKQYGGICAGGLKKAPLHHYLKTISLELHFSNGRKACCIPFYEKKKDQALCIPALEVKARTWQTIVSDLLPEKAG